MGFLDFLLGGRKCPLCGTRGVRESERSDVRVRCPNPACPYFDPAVQPATVKLAGALLRRRDFVPEHPIEIRYRNFQNTEQTFNAEKTSLRRKRNHILARVVPTGEHITLSRDRILNLGEVESAVPQVAPPAGPVPRGRDLQVLNYHKKHGSSSALYEKVRAKYPGW